MTRLTAFAADALKDILRRDGFEMESVEYPHLFMLHRTPIVNQEHDSRNEPVQKVFINIRGKHHASWWMKGRREEFGIPAVEFAVYCDAAKSLGVSMYFFFYEDVSKMISYISSNDVLLKARIWEQDNVDVGGTLFVPKRYVVPLARLEDGVMRYINHFIPEKFSVQTVIS